LQSELDSLIDPLPDDESVFHTSTPNTLKVASQDSSSNNSVQTGKDFREPSENDFETVKLISNGAYGAVFLVRHKETRQPFALKKINKLNLILRNQVAYKFSIYQCFILL